MKAYSINNTNANGNGWMKFYNNDGRLVRETELEGWKETSTTRYSYEGRRLTRIVETDAQGNVINEWRA